MPEEQASFDYSLGMRPTKLIGFCGVGGSGKTTTARRMAEVTQIPFHELSARPTFKRWHLDSEAAQLALTEEQRYHLQMDIHQDFEDNLRHLPGGPGITDRTPLDHMAYALHYCHTVLDEGRWANIVLNTKRRLERFEYIFYFPLVTWPSHSDGMRRDDWGYRLLYDTILQQVLKQYFPQHYTVRLGEVDARVAGIAKACGLTTVWPIK